jgi:hypothetical protein
MKLLDQIDQIPIAWKKTHNLNAEVVHLKGNLKLPFHLNPQLLESIILDLKLTLNNEHFFVFTRIFMHFKVN